MTGLFDLIGMTEEENNLAIGFNKIDSELEQCMKILDETIHSDNIETSRSESIKKAIHILEKTYEDAKFYERCQAEIMKGESN